MTLEQRCAKSLSRKVGSALPLESLEAARTEGRTASYANPYRKDDQEHYWEAFRMGQMERNAGRTS